MLSTVSENQETTVYSDNGILYMGTKRHGKPIFIIK